MELSLARLPPRVLKLKRAGLILLKKFVRSVLYIVGFVHDTDPKTSETSTATRQVYLI